MRQIAQLEKSYMKSRVTRFKPGDTVKVHVKIIEGDKERIQVFQGTVISRRGGGTNETFTVRKMSSGIGVERVFPLHSPNITRIKRVRMGKVRRSKLYYLRDLTGKSARIEEQLEDKLDAAETVAEKPIEEKPKAEKPKEKKPKEKKRKAKVKAAEPPKEEPGMAESEEAEALEEGLEEEAAAEEEEKGEEEKEEAKKS